MGKALHQTNSVLTPSNCKTISGCAIEIVITNPIPNKQIPTGPFPFENPYNPQEAYFSANLLQQSIYWSASRSQYTIPSSPSKSLVSNFLKLRSINKSLNAGKSAAMISRSWSSGTRYTDITINWCFLCAENWCQRSSSVVNSGCIGSPCINASNSECVSRVSGYETRETKLVETRSFSLFESARFIIYGSRNR